MISVRFVKVSEQSLNAALVFSWRHLFRWILFPIPVWQPFAGYVEDTCGVTFDGSAFRYGNLKPDLTGTYLTKRHYPSIMYDEVMDKIRRFVDTYTIEQVNGRDLSVDLGEICHYLTDFFCYPHNDDIYDHNLLAHYIYEKRIALGIRRRLTEQDFNRWVAPVLPPFYAGRAHEPH